MSAPQVNPQEVFRGTLPVGASQVVIFVPSVDREGKPINQDYWVDQILTTLGHLFRGATAYPRGRGVWRDDQRGGLLIKERTCHRLFVCRRRGPYNRRADRIIPDFQSVGPRRQSRRGCCYH